VPSNSVLNVVTFDDNADIRNWNDSDVNKEVSPNISLHLSQATTEPQEIKNVGQKRSHDQIEKTQKKTKMVPEYYEGYTK